MSTPLPPSLKARTQRRDPYVTGLGFLIVIAAVGFVMIALGKRSLARTLDVAFQLPSFVSGCVAGLALIATAVAMIVILHARRVEAELRQQTDQVIDEAAALVAAMAVRKSR
jgi:ABC-type Fe3+ transport system permease subunit